MKAINPEDMTAEEADRRYRCMLDIIVKDVLKKCSRWSSDNEEVLEALFLKVRQDLENIGNPETERWKVVASGEPLRLKSYLLWSASKAAWGTKRATLTDGVGEEKCERSESEAKRFEGADELEKLLQCVGGKIEGKLDPETKEKRFAQKIREIFSKIDKNGDVLKGEGAENLLNLSALTRQIVANSDSEDITRYFVEKSTAKVTQFMRECRDEFEYPMSTRETRMTKSDLRARLKAILATPSDELDTSSTIDFEEPSIEEVDRVASRLELLEAVDNTPVRLELSDARGGSEEVFDLRDEIFTLDAAADDGDVATGPFAFNEEQEWDFFYVVISDDGQCTVEYCLPEGYGLGERACQLEFARGDEFEVVEVEAHEEDGFAYIECGQVALLRRRFRGVCRKWDAASDDVVVSVLVPVQRRGDA